MDSQDQSGQVLIDALMTFVFFAGIFIALQALIDHHKERANTYKLSREVKYEVRPTKN